MNYYLSVLKKWSDFSSRSPRIEYWMFVLFNFIAFTILGAADNSILGGSGILAGLYGLFVLVPGLAVAVRRLHDTNRTGWWILINFVPAIGWIVFLIFMVLDSSPGANQYGPNPKEGGGSHDDVPSPDNPAPNQGVPSQGIQQ